ncbi:hypothetical protein [Methylomonas fluvii]|uniref:Uncharacterized protein n=1 Tax=Methylomonas fluvii TaxID=1854564 RepID=A0ABR9DHX2_9GAMM|nr:hypothetical protein [Methylomonas fluvii]MBD9361492.1 hypothetical protein [Methylomonas fluvii]
MDNDILINQARQLYAALHASQLRLMPLNPGAWARLERLLSSAYCRYQRRLNRCVLCYQYRKHDCIREPGEKSMPCRRRQPLNSLATF